MLNRLLKALRKEPVKCDESAEVKKSKRQIERSQKKAQRDAQELKYLHSAVLEKLSD